MKDNTPKRPAPADPSPPGQLPTESELNLWREQLRQEYVQQCANGDGANHWPLPEYSINRSWLARFVAEWKERFGWFPRPWEILTSRANVLLNNPRAELREIEDACLACGVDPRTTTLANNYFYRYLLLPGVDPLTGDVAGACRGNGLVSLPATTPFTTAYAVTVGLPSEN